MRVDEEETGGVGENFDPISVLSNTKTKYQNTIMQSKVLYITVIYRIQ